MKELTTFEIFMSQNKKQHVGWRWLDRLQNYILIAPDSSFSVSSERDGSLGRLIIKSVPLLLSLLLFLLFYKAHIFYFSPKTLVEEDPLVVNLSAAKVPTQIKFGTSPLCGNTECWTLPDADLSSWTETVLPLNPNKNITGLPGYEEASKLGQSTYYYTQLEIPEKLIGIKEEISFSQLFIQHEKFEVFLNGKKVFVSDGIGLGRIGNFPIPKDEILEGKATFVIKASLGPHDRGIAHFGSAYLGPKHTLDSVYLFSERALFSFYLLFVLTKGAVFVVFTLFFFFGRVQTGFVNFLIFAFFVTIENLFMGEFFADTYMTLQNRAFCTYMCKALAIAGLLRFFVELFHAKRLRNPSRIFNAIAITIIGAMAFDLAWGTETISFRLIWQTTNAFLISMITASATLGIITIHAWKKRHATGNQIRTYQYVTGFLVVYFALCVDQFYFNSYVANEGRNLYELAFFFLLAMVTARDMGTQEKKITSLQVHMEEKSRMELELQEAAEIARAFLPDELPDWTSMNISSFHKPLTENSGDWFAFEGSESGRYYHYIMCDITGHGVQAAIVVSTCKSILSSITHTRSELLESTNFIMEFMRELNHTLYHNGGGYHVSTLLGMTFEPAAKKVYYISAGHPAPLYIDSSDAQMKPRALISRHNVLGIRETFSGNLRSHQFNPGDQLITFTDGLPVGSNIKALRKFLQEYPETHGNEFNNAPKILCQKIWDAETHRTKIGMNDDVSVVWFESVA